MFKRKREIKKDISLAKKLKERNIRSITQPNFIGI